MVRSRGRGRADASRVRLTRTGDGRGPCRGASRRGRDRRRRGGRGGHPPCGRPSRHLSPRWEAVRAPPSETFLPGRAGCSPPESSPCWTAARACTDTTGTCVARSSSAGASASQVHKLEAVEAAVGKAIAAVKPGVTVGEIGTSPASAIARSGYADNWWHAFMPHGNGTGQHEPPNAKQHPGQPLLEGMVLCIEPGLTVPRPGRGDHRADDRRRGRRRDRPERAAHRHVGCPVKLQNRASGRRRRQQQRQPVRRGRPAGVRRTSTPYF